MIMAIILTLMFKQCLIAAEGFQYFKSSDQYSSSSDLLQTYGCLEETNVTYITYSSTAYEENYRIDGISNFLAALEDPCTTISFYDHSLREVVPWNGEKSKFDSSLKTEFDDVEFEELIASFNDPNFGRDSTAKQILLVDLSDIYKSIDGVNEKIGLIEKNTKWNVILTCYYMYCPIIPHLPIHRIVMGWDYQARVKDLVQNPDFNKLEFLKHVKIDNKNLTCLANKTVHMFSRLPSSFVELLEVIALINYNTNDTTKFIIYDTNSNKNSFNTYFLKQTGLDSYNISIAYGHPWYHLKQTGDSVFFFDIEFTTYMRIEEFTSSVRNSAFIYTTSGKEDELTLSESIFYQRNGFKKIVQLVLSKVYKLATEFHKNFMEDILNASCF